MKQITCGFIGFGLIGGSIAKALKENCPDIAIYACDTNPDAMLLAKEEGIVSVVTDGIDSTYRDCDYLFLCAPVSCNEENLLSVKSCLSPGCILTDVGSVKTGIHRQAKRLGLAQTFIGGHPMTGSERYGYANSRAKLLENAYYILTPSRETPADSLNRFRELIALTGAIPLIMDYRQHDYVTAAVSHLPHVIAASLVNLVRTSDSPDGIMKMIAAGGFKDITRIASSSAPMWQQICLTNTVNISSLLAAYIQSLKEVKRIIDSKDESAIYHFFDTARIYRDSFAEASNGPIKKVFSLRVDIPDEPGAIASIATMLALNNINIRNIGIAHNREAQEGVLGIEFYEQEGMDKAASLLRARNYVVHEK